jgi:hypothetical protein
MVYFALPWERAQRSLAQQMVILRLPNVMSQYIKKGKKQVNPIPVTGRGGS